MEFTHMTDPRTQEAIALMNRFAERTGLASERPQRRYLWTDAFAVCNFLGLARLTGEARYAELAVRLVDRVHHTLGRHRDDGHAGAAAHGGWISGLSEGEGEAHPTRGGLRIGKELPERAPGQAYDERLEWERDGQYFHYLAQWMHALDQSARASGQARFSLWARELAETAQHAFANLPAGGGPRRMYWKMSIDLTRPLVPSMGQHDPLDAYVTYLQLRSTATGLPQPAGEPSLGKEIGQAEAMLQEGDWATTDPLGLGALLIDACRLQQLKPPDGGTGAALLESLLEDSLAGLQVYAGSGELRLPAEHRLAFRELGLAIGLHAVRLMWQAAERDPAQPPHRSGLRARLQALMKHAATGDAIESFWRNPEHRRSRTWSEHLDINEVMLATSLVPDGYLVLPPPG